MISKLTCGKCGFRFNYRFIPGVSVTSVRLGIRRYMKCPNCGKFSLFSLADAGEDENLPTYSDTGATAKLFIFLVIMIPLATLIARRYLSKNPSSLAAITGILVALVVAMVFIAIRTGLSKEN